MSNDGWIANRNGNWVWIDSGELLATVYATDNDVWGAIWNGAADGSPRRLKERFDCAGDAMEALEIAVDEGEGSPKWRQPDDQWIERKGGGYYRKMDDVPVSVKEAKSKSWYAVRMGGELLGQHGRASWFATAEEACNAVDALDRGSGSWCWITRC
jgi:hypothetical protein